MLVEQPHALGRVDGRAAADGDDDVRLEGVHGLDAAHDALNGRVAFHVGVDLAVAVFLALAQVVQDFVHIAQLHHHRVGDDEGAGDALHLFQVLDGILLKIDAGRHLEPLHVHPPLGDALFVDVVHGIDVLGHAVLAI